MKTEENYFDENGEYLSDADTGRIWCKANGANVDWQARILLGQMAAELAPQVMDRFGLAKERSLVPLFIDGWRLDYASPVICGILEVCAARLQRAV